MKDKNNQSWCISQAREFYNIPIWSEGYFDVNSLGHIVAKTDAEHEIDLVEVVQQLVAQKISLPVLLRFPQILQARVKQLCEAFEKAAVNSGYPIQHTAFYPIKVNQQKSVVEHLLLSKVKRVGLEVGTKTELLAALGLMQSSNGALICNGYKDRAYIRLALFAQDMGIELFLVIESYSELALIIEESEALNIKPILGVRVRLNTIAAGKWQNSGGHEAKFGLAAMDLLNLTDALKQQGWEQQLKVLHCHMGSQISNQQDFESGICELMSWYREFHQQGFSPDIVDIGGGLAVDYSSTRDTSYFSKAYNIETYAQTVIDTIGQYCMREKLPFPHVVSENGRALTAHHAVLVTNVVDVESADDKAQTPLKYKHAEQVNTKKSNIAEAGQGIRQQIEQLRKNGKISDQEQQNILKQCAQQFADKHINLQQRVELERYLSASSQDRLSVDKYYVNLSVFQSLPDAWGLDQIFPIMPLSQLDEQPNQQAVLHDLTCDSDGQLKYYPYAGEVHRSLFVHAIHRQQYLMGFFLVGAYQEVLGDMHNLFGDTHAVNVKLTSDNDIQLFDFEIGDCVHELLSTIHIDPSRVVENCRDKMQLANNQDLTMRLNEIEAALHGYTYLDSMNRPAQRIKD